jgi:hypothetical protein
VYLDWRTASEVANAGFEVYRALEADSSYTLIASYITNPGLAGFGTTSEGHRYSLVDGGDGALQVGETYLYRLVDVATDGTRTEHEAKSVMINGGVTPGIYSFFRLHQMAPNPSAGDVRVSFSLADAGAVKIEVLNMAGEVMMTPIDGREYQAGEHGETISTTGLPAGSYMVRMSAGRSILTRPLTVVR